MRAVFINYIAYSCSRKGAAYIRGTKRNMTACAEIATLLRALCCMISYTFADPDSTAAVDCQDPGGVQL